MEFLAKIPVRVALVTVGTAAVAAGSYLIGRQHGAVATMVQADQYIREVLASFDREVLAPFKENPDATTK